MLVIGVDARNLIVRPTGIGRYIIESCKSLIEMGHILHLYLPSKPYSYDILPSDAHIHASHASGSILRIIWGLSQVGHLARRDKVDVFWGPAHRLPFRQCISMPSVLTIHDLVWRAASDTMRTKNYIAEKTLMLPAIRNATRVVAVSEATRNDIIKLFPKEANKIDRIYPGWASIQADDDAEQTIGPTSTDRYGLFVGTLEPRKNLLNLLTAYSMLPEDIRRQNKLIIAGGQGWRMPDLEKVIVQLNLSDYVQLRGYVTDKELANLYKNARFLAMPSKFEGFGLPIIEANSFGVPVITSNCSSMPEVAGNAGLIIDPYNVDSIKQAMQSIMTNDELHTRLSKKSRENVARFDWRKSAENLTKTFETAIIQYSS